MIPFKNLAQVRLPEGSVISLHEHDGDFFLKHNGRQLMSTTATESELELADHGCAHLARHPAPRILIGGLGLGYTLRRALELTGPGAVVEVSELIPEVITWNEQYLAGINGGLLKDPRVKVLAEDVFAIIKRAAAAPYDAILLDVDHTPASWVQAKNARLYDRHGFQLLERALSPLGRAAYWSATDEPEFVRRLSNAGFAVKAFEAKAYPNAKRAAHRIYLAERRDPNTPAQPGPAPKPRKGPPPRR